MPRRRLMLIVGACCILAFPVGLSAQEETTPPEQGGELSESTSLSAQEEAEHAYRSALALHGSRNRDRFGRDQAGRQQRKHLEQLRILKLLELLDLNEDQETGFIVAFRSYRKQKRSLGQDRQERVTELAEGLRQGVADDNEIYTAVREIQEMEDRGREIDRDFFREVQPVLTAEQFGRLVVFQERFEYELLEMVRGFRERGRGRHGGGGPGPHQPLSDEYLLDESKLNDWR